MRGTTTSQAINVAGAGVRDGHDAQFPLRSGVLATNKGRPRRCQSPPISFRAPSAWLWMSGL